MKAEHRHELKTNALADSVGHFLQGLKTGPSRHALVLWGLVIAAVVIGLTAYFLFKSSREAGSALWVKVDDAQRKLEFAADAEQVQAALKNFDTDAAAHPGTPQARALRFDRARTLFREGLERLAADRDKAVKDLKDARDLYAALEKETSGGDKDVALLNQEALLSVAKADEALGNLDEALGGYKKLAERYPNSIRGKAAKERADYLGDEANRKHAQELYAKLDEAARAQAAPPSEKPQAAVSPMSDPTTTALDGQKTVELTAKHKVEGMRLDQYLVGMFSDYSRSVVRRVIDAGGVLVNGRPGKASYKVRHGDHVKIWLPAPTHEAPVPEDIPLNILYEDEFLAVVNKPHDMVVHPAKGHWSGTLVNALQFHFGQLSHLTGDYRPGIVHRLDRDTSGVILVAKDELTHRDLSYQFESRKVFKEYRALTQGVLDRDSDYIEARIGKHPTDRVKMAALDADDEEDGKDACSYYEVIERFKGYTFCRIFPRTGRTHQIRVHLGSVGCPVLADKIYGGRDTLKLSDLVPGLGPDDDEVLLSRQALHAARLRFFHPRLRRTIEAEAPLPPELERTLAALRKHRPPR